MERPELLKRPLYGKLEQIFDLPPELLATLTPKDGSTTAQPLPTEVQASSTRSTPQNEGTKGIIGSSACGLCGLTFKDPQEQREHARSDHHNYNLKLKLRGHAPIDEKEFEKIIGDLDVSLSGSDSATEEDEEVDGPSTSKDARLAALLRKQAKITDGTDNAVPIINKKIGSPLMWFTTPRLSTNISLGIYKSIFSKTEQDHEASILETLRNKQLAPTPRGSQKGPLLPKAPHIFLCMIGGGHFAAMVVSLRPKLEMKGSGIEEREATVLAHKTFHRYTTRRKQGGAQSANDSAKGAAHSAGSSLRRYNEVALENEVRQQLGEWKELIDSSELLFVRATGSTNRRTLYGPYEGQVLKSNDERLRGFPFSTRRATQKELMRAFVELMRVKVSQIDEAALRAAAEAESQRVSQPPKAAKSSASPTPKLSKEDEEASLHTTQLQALIRRSKAPAIIAYMAKNNIPSTFAFFPSDAKANHHAPTPLHLAASINSPAVIIALLAKSNVDPTLLNHEGKTPFELAGDRATRDAFRVARSELGEDKWDWIAARIPVGLTRTEAEKRDKRDRAEADKAEAIRRKTELERIRQEEAQAKPQKKMTGRTVGTLEKTASEKREEEARGMTPEMRMRLERERRARAAEERMRRMQGGTGR
ncbi:MAG: Ankyrin repeat and zinc finger domain-containing protein 1 [Cirrosporium novae-zelandiae]|nr:MAG: Ankyrin repeat and zinc finger domain-containing protein 1 [Cirrosporium novae-zelandiae]